VIFGRHATSRLSDYLFNFVSPEMAYDNGVNDVSKQIMMKVQKNTFRTPTK